MYVDIYAAASDMEAKRIIALLEGEGIEATQIQNASSVYPAAGEEQFLVAVRKKSIKQAREVIDQARKDGIIS